MSLETHPYDDEQYSARWQGWWERRMSARHSGGLTKAEILEGGCLDQLANIMTRIHRHMKSGQVFTGVQVNNLEAMIKAFGRARWEQGYYCGLVNRGLTKGDDEQPEDM